MAKQITLENVTKRFGKLIAVDDVDLAIPAGSFATLVGPSGSGKTTLLRMIAGLEEVTDGRVTIGDRDVTDASPQDRPLSMVFQDIALYPHMSCRENIGYGLKIQGVPAAERTDRIEEAARNLQIEDQLDKPPSELSGGQQQRVALGRAFVEDPEVLLFDEPMSDLDAKLKEELRVEFQRLHRRLDATFVYVTHDQNEAMTMSDYIAVMNAGRIAQFDDPETVFHDPDSEHVATFIGTPSTNVLVCPVENGVAKLPGTTVRLPEEARRYERVKLGIRPQYLSVGGGEVAFDVVVDVVEPLGTEYVVHTTLADDGRDGEGYGNNGGTGPTQVNVVTDAADEMQAGETVTVGTSLESAYLFTPNGERIRFAEGKDEVQPP
ncbi:MAG: ABC transporter ATP-binding protein [Halobacteriales archaeon]